MIRRQKPARAAARPTGPRAADDFATIGGRLKELEVADFAPLSLKLAPETMTENERALFGVDLVRSPPAWEIEFEKTLPGRDYAVLFIAPDGTLLGPGVGFGVDARAGYCIRENGQWSETTELEFKAAVERERQAALMPQVKRLDLWDDKTWNGIFSGPSKAAGLASAQNEVNSAMRDMLVHGVGHERIYMAPRSVGKTHAIESANKHHLRSCLLKELLESITNDGRMLVPWDTLASILRRARATFSEGGD